MKTTKAKTKASKTNLALSFGDAVMLVLGVCLLIWADKVTSFISIAFGILMLIYAAYTIIDCLRTKQNSSGKIITAIALCIAGLFLIIQNGFLKELVSAIIGIFIVIIGIVKLQNAIHSKPYNPKYLTPLILALIEILCGVLCITGRFIVPDLILQFLGVLLIISSLSDIIGSIMIYKAPKGVEKEAIEAEIIDKPAKK
jgi:uncharacterized membrane protein HdeD (DUF308 family)